MEDPKQPGVNQPAAAPGQQPGPQVPPNPAEPPKPDGAKPPEPKEPGSNTDPSQLLAALKEERERRRAAEAERDVYRNQPPQQPQQPAMQPQTDWQKKLDELWDTDPRKAVQMEMQMGFQWFDQLAAGLEQQKDEVRGKYSDFNKYEAQAMTYVRSLPIQQRATRGVVEMAYLIEKGKFADQIRTQAQQDAIDQVIKRLQAGESIQGISGGAGQPATPQGPQLTPDQIRVAEAMNMTTDDYIKHMKK